jgi:hypothetical protein
MRRVGSPSEVVDAAYELLSFEPGQEPDWAGFNECFHGRAILALRVCHQRDLASQREACGRAGHLRLLAVRALAVTGQLLRVADTGRA